MDKDEETISQDLEKADQQENIIKLLSELKSNFEFEDSKPSDNTDNINNSFESISYSLEDYDDEEEEKEKRNIKNVEMKSILSNLANIKIEEEKEEDIDDKENREFFKYIHNKVFRKIRLNLNDRKKLVELNKMNPKKYSNVRLSMLTGVKPKAITAYKSAYKELCEQENLKCCRVKKPTVKTCYENDAEILNFVDKLREQKKAVTTNMIMAKMLQLKPELKELKKKTLQKRVYRFLDRNNYSIRKASHVGQPLPLKALDLFYEFFRDIVRKRVQLGIYDNMDDYDRIVNIDETPVYFEMITDKTINKKGVKVISVETKGNEKKLISCVLAVSAGGKKLIPTLIFKGGRDGNLETKYKNLEVVKNKKIVIYFQSNAWCDEAIFKRWVKDVYINYEEEIIKKKCILIMDKSPSHIYRSKYLEKKGKNYVFIPGGLTRYLQPLDIGINRQFKDQLKNNYLTDMAENIGDNDELKEEEKMKQYYNAFGDSKNPSELDKQRLNVINWVIDVWWDDEKIKISSILNSFRKAAINFPLDGSRDVEFVFPDEVINQTD